MPYYESVFIARQDISAPQVEAMSDAFSKVIEELGGKVVKKENWGLRNLAYRIKKNRKGHYVLFNIDGPASVVQELERQMRLNEDVLRYLTVSVEELEEGPSAMMQRGAGRDDRTRRDGRPRYEERPRRDDRPRRKDPEKEPDAVAAATPAKTPESTATTDVPDEKKPEVNGQPTEGKDQ